MQLGEAQRGFSSKSKLFDSLKVYLDNKNRLQPIIGLGSIIECVKAGTHNREALYMCEVCMCRLSKGDMRNHIMGSFHRYNYIKAWHPHLLSGWKENSDLSKLAWPLMDIAKVLEGKEGPGDIQLLEVEDNLYQKMATHSENDAITLINLLRDGQGHGEPENHLEATPVQLDHYPSQSHRIVLFAQNQKRRSEKSFSVDMISHKTSAQTIKTPPLLHSAVAPPVTSDGWLKNISVSHFENTQMSPEPSVLPRNSNSFIDGYTGTKPLIGLFRVVECRSEYGRTYCFLCHCCCVRCNKKDIIDHLTSSSHLTNYLMETHPEQVEVMTTAVNDCQFLQSLAKKVEQEEGRGELKVVNAPESLCILLTGKSYNWCIKMLCSGWTDTNSRQVALKRPSVNMTPVQGMPKKCAVVPSKQAQNMTAKRRKKKKEKKVTNTVFKVSLPLTKGAVLLKRTSFSKDGLPLSYEYSPSSDPDYITSPESQSEDFELDSDTGSFAFNHTEHISVCTTSQLQQDLCSEDAGDGQHMGPKGNSTVTWDQEVDGNFGHNEYFTQSEDITGTKDQKVYLERNYNRQHGSQERSNDNFNKDLKNEDLQTQYEGLSRAVSHTQNWSSYNSFYGCNEGYTEQWYSLASQSKFGTGVEVSREEGQKEMSSDATQHHYQHQPQYMAQDHTSLVPGRVGYHGLSGELVPHLDTAGFNMYHCIEDSHAHSASAAPEPRTQFHETEQRQLQTCMELAIGHFPTAPQSYMTEPMACQAIQVGYGVMCDPKYNIGSRTNNYQHFSHPVSGGSGRGMCQSNAYNPPWQAPCYRAQPDVNFRATGLSSLRISGCDSGTAPFMHSLSQFEFSI